MKITYKENPLATVIELDDHEKEVMRLKLKLEIYEDRAFAAHWALANIGNELRGQIRTKDMAIEQAMKELDPDYLLAENGEGIEKRTDDLLTWYLQELQSWHDGDCTAFPASCCKCHAEDMLGLNTIKGIGKHQGYALSQYFARGRTLNELIEDVSLKQELRDWLRNHRDVHLSEKEV